MSSPSAIDKTLMVLDAVLEHSRFTDVVTATGLAKSTVHRIMASLVEHEFVAQSEDGSYHPGPKALRLAGHALTNVDLATVARPVLADLVAQTRCTVHVGLLNGDEAIYVARLDGPKPYRMPSRVGKAFWLHCTGIGKALLAERDEEALDALVTRTGLPARTPLTHTTASSLKADLAQVKSRGSTDPSRTGCLRGSARPSGCTARESARHCWRRRMTKLSMHSSPAPGCPPGRR